MWLVFKRYSQVVGKTCNSRQDQAIHCHSIMCWFPSAGKCFWRSCLGSPTTKDSWDGFKSGRLWRPIAETLTMPRESVSLQHLLRNRNFWITYQKMWLITKPWFEMMHLVLVCRKSVYYRGQPCNHRGVIESIDFVLRWEFLKAGKCATVNVKLESRPSWSVVPTWVEFLRQRPCIILCDLRSGTNIMDCGIQSINVLVQVVGFKVGRCIHCK